MNLLPYIIGYVITHYGEEITAYDDVERLVEKECRQILEKISTILQFDSSDDVKNLEKLQKIIRLLENVRGRLSDGE